MNFAYNGLRRAKTSIAWGAALLILAVVVSTAAAQPTEVLVYNFDPTGNILGGTADSTTTVDGITDRSGNGYNGTCTSLLGYPGAMKFQPGHTGGTPVAGGTTGVALAMAGLDDFPTTSIFTGAATPQLGITPTTTTVGPGNGSFTCMAWVYRTTLRHNTTWSLPSYDAPDVNSSCTLGFT